MGSIAKMLNNNGIETVTNNISTRMALEDVKLHGISYAMGDALYPMASEKEILQILDRTAPPSTPTHGRASTRRRQG